MRGQGALCVQPEDPTGAGLHFSAGQGGAGGVFHVRPQDGADEA